MCLTAGVMPLLGVLTAFAAQDIKQQLGIWWGRGCGWAWAGVSQMENSTCGAHRSDRAHVGASRASCGFLC